MVAASCPKRKEPSSKTSRSSDKKKNEKRRKHRDREREKREKYPSCVDGAKYYPKAVPASEGDKRTNSKSTFSLNYSRNQNLCFEKKLKIAQNYHKFALKWYFSTLVFWGRCYKVSVCWFRRCSGGAHFRRSHWSISKHQAKNANWIKSF